MKSDLQIVADALRKYGYDEVATEIESSEIVRDIDEAKKHEELMELLSDNYGSGE
jgi:hypothetical protein